MLRKISITIAGSMLLSGAAAAASVFAVQPAPTFPSSVNEAGPNYPIVAAERMFAPVGTTGAAGEARSVGSITPEVKTPSSVNEAYPEMAGG